MLEKKVFIMSISITKILIPVISLCSSSSRACKQITSPRCLQGTVVHCQIY